MKCLEVAVAAPLYHTLTYLPPKYSTSDLVAGVRLLVPLGGRRVTGYLLDIQSAADPSLTKKLKNVVDVLDSEPLFPVQLIPFFRWIAEYYHYPIGQVIQNGLPSGLTVKSGHYIELTEKGSLLFNESLSTSWADRMWAQQLSQKGCLTAAATRKVLQSDDRKQIALLIKEGVLTQKQSVSKSRVAPKTETFISLTNYSEVSESDERLFPSLKPSEQKTVTLLRNLLEEQGDLEQGAVPKKTLTSEYSSAGRALKGLADKKIISLFEHPIYRDPLGRITSYVTEPHTLTNEQKKVLGKIIPAVKDDAFKTFLLHGVTGSGKTEVYIQAASAALSMGKTVLILVPEIALATQIETYFLSRFEEKVAILHSGLSQGEFYDQWRKVMQAKVQIVIGARSAIFAPLVNLGLIIVDEEHESAYKQEDGLRYQARDLAVLRGSQEKCAVVLGSATPSIISKYHCDQGKYTLLELHKRIHERPLPTVEVVDLKTIRTVSNHPPLFSNQLLKALKENLAKGHQSLLFLNRRGFANVLLCGDCGKNLQCKNCQVTLTLHKKKQELLCHYCGFSMRSAAICPHCQSTNILQVGYGTERIEHELAAVVPKAKLARLDRDTCVKRKDYISILKDMHEGNIDILVGTQMIAKGHHFPNVTLVGIIWADAGLGVPDFRSSERTFQLLMQVTGRAGRGGVPGRVIVQTHQPDHYSILLAQKHDYQGLYDREIALRKSLQYPPYARIVNFRLSGSNEEDVRYAALQLTKVAQQMKGDAKSLRILGPVAAPLARLRNKFRWQVLLMGSNRKFLHSVSDMLFQKTQKMSFAKKVNISIDVDPENLL